MKMNRIAKFEKISFNQFLKDWTCCFPQSKEDEVKIIYESIHLPQRVTQGSAGYDFFSPCDIALRNSVSNLKSFILYHGMNIHNHVIKIPTGIRCFIEDNWVLQIYPRSSHGFKYGVHLVNTVGIIDSDYYNSDNEGHIFVKLINDSAIEKGMEVKTGEAFCQGVFIPYGITVDDHTEQTRNGGIGSTGKSY